MKKLILIIILLLSTTIPAIAAAKLSMNCNSKNFKFSQTTLLLNTVTVQSQQLFLLHNISSQSFWLDHPTHSSASAGWGSPITAKNWSALLLNNSVRNFAVTCKKIDNGQSKKLICENLLQVCQLPSAKIPSTMTGSFWLAENQTLPQLLQRMQQRGIQVKNN